MHSGYLQVVKQLADLLHRQGGTVPPHKYEISRNKSVMLSTRASFLRAVPEKSTQREILTMAGRLHFDHGERRVPDTGVDQLFVTVPVVAFRSRAGLTVFRALVTACGAYAAQQATVLCHEVTANIVQGAQSQISTAGDDLEDVLLAVHLQLPHKMLHIAVGIRTDQVIATAVLFCHRPS